ncbi:DUF2325 domain-containing protein [Lentilactobacillus hilgardii]|uniref:DUF2325 domain-containing protein n=1 Tax=Lentilactobacillus hilgardii TaxID=1588 RepID=A0A6P1E3X4_LENHI|nr:DUF2325 domain-containing protein [Lentilactobacillus hilgardii]EEI71808.1 hypothetical protein HMPREF0496_0952 [Lentilactobacillus hilgardii ATCC 27305]MCT3393055.1 DUF2325 domain-containing protein [Lentilactobacillus hilgardii]QHB51348.1 DUF2325 domain-containing protein [Lentilactobacillus hilgardii]RRG10352.1 MAG: DUF2325 domain-containing protein [Lactobacillus sp.]
MAAKTYLDYCRDVAKILQYADKENMPLITDAIGIISKYAHLASSVENKDDSDSEKSVQKIVDAINKPQSDKEQQPAGDENQKTDKDTIDKVVDKPEETAADDKTYRFDRKLIGAVVNGIHYSETVIRKTDLKDGDIVKLKYSHSYQPEIELVARQASTGEDPIVRKTVIAEDDPNLGLVAKKAYDGTPLLHDDAPVTIRLNYKDSSRNKVQDGDIIDIAYYRDRGPAEARVAWVYRSSDTDEPLKTAPKPHSAYVDQSDKTPRIVEPKLDFDLKNKTVLMAGYSAHRSEVDDVIKAHHGKLIVFDGEASGKGIESDLLTAVKHADIVIVMLHSVSHETANKAITNAKNFDKLVATSNINSPLSIEAAILRALNREPIYQQSSHIVE